MSSKCFFGIVILVVVASLTTAEIPAYFKVCGRRNPQLEKCVIDAVENLRDKLRTGIPELGTPSLEPLKFDYLPMSDTDVLKAVARNVNFTGFSNFETKSFKVDLEKKRFDIVVSFNRLILDADYDVQAKILVPIASHGPIHVVNEDVQADVILKYKLIKKHGGEYMFFPTMTTKLHIKDFKATFRPVEGSDSTVATAINAAIQGGRQEIIESITPNVEKVVSTEIIKLANKICSHFTFDELFPDRE